MFNQMDDNNNIQDKIDRYLLNKMIDEEKHLFEEELITNSDLNEKVTLQKLLFDEITRRGDFFSILKSADRNRETQEVKEQTKAPVDILYGPDITTISANQAESVLVLQNIEKDKRIATQSIIRLKYFSIAAMVIGISLIVYMQPTKFSNQKILDNYAFVYPGNYATEASSDINTRDINNLYLTFDSLEIKDINNALKLYEGKNYNLAANSFKKIQNLKNRDTDLTLYFAIALLKSGKSEEAITTLEFLINKPYYQSKEVAYYYLALAFIQSDNLSDARKILKILRNSNGTYSKNAAEILNKMRLF